MARLSTANEGLAGSVFYTYSATPGSGQGTALRSALATNLLLMNVSTLKTFSAGTTETNYIVLSFKQALPITASGGSGTFGMLETVSATGGGTGKFLKESGGIVYLIDYSGTFTGTITGSPSGATRTITSVGSPIGSAHEILIYIPNGTASTIASGIHSSYQGGDNYSTGETLPIGFSLAPEGGFNSSFTSGFNPANQNFWDDITVTQNKLAPTLVHRIKQWKTAAAGQSIFFIEDDEPGSGFMAIYGRTTASTTDFVNAFIVTDLIDQAIENTGIDKVYQSGFIWMEGNNTAKPKVNNLTRIVYWNFNARERRIITTNISNQSIFRTPGGTAIASGAFPTGDTTIPSARVPIVGSGEIPAKFASTTIRFIPENVNHANKFGNDNNFKFIEVIKGWGLPWDNFKANPNW